MKHKKAFGQNILPNKIVTLADVVAKLLYRWVVPPVTARIRKPQELRLRRNPNEKEK